MTIQDKLSILYSFNFSRFQKKNIHNLNPTSSSFQESKCNLIMSMLEYSDCEWNKMVVERRHVVAIFIITKIHVEVGVRCAISKALSIQTGSKFIKSQFF